MSQLKQKQHSDVEIVDSRMEVLVIYDSFFGNTEQIARAIGNSFDFSEGVGMYRVGDVNQKQLKGLELLIIGSPTRGFKPTEAIIKFINKIPSNGLTDIKVAAFDTRFSLSSIESSALRFIVKTGGYAAKSIANLLKKKGGDLIIPPEGFYVTGEEGPLKEGELKRAADWAKQIITTQ